MGLAVTSASRARRGGGALLLALFALGACQAADGGAVELSWRLRPEPGPLPNNPCEPFVCCDPGQALTNPVDRIKLTWTIDGAGSAQGSSESWDCNAGNGVTHFDVPVGDVLLTVAPVCVGHDADPTTYVAPAAIQRTVRAGDTVSLGAIELLLRVSSCDVEPCICQ